MGEFNKQLELSFTEQDINKAKENFRKKETGDGKRGPFYNGKQEWSFCDKNELFQNAVWQGYLDACRTFGGIKGTKEKKSAFDNLASSIRNYLIHDNASFDHSDWCNKLINEIENENMYKNMRFGQAQKIVNMAFKYLYCCDKAQNYIKKFDKCHMPLDQYTLAWYFSISGELYQGWSYFGEDKYVYVQNIIERWLEKQNKGCVKRNILDYELVIWDYMQDKIINLKPEKSSDK